MLCTQWRALCEIDAGICDGLTYEDIKKRWPEEFAARKKDKLRYRYPRGESYLDLIERLEPVIFELERLKFPVVVVGHQAVLRCLYAYFWGENTPQMSDIPFVAIPLHTVLDTSIP
jgi:6-phosphofructo-2-kinase/fructose-2,6-biphosphatase